MLSYNADPLHINASSNAAIAMEQLSNGALPSDPNWQTGSSSRWGIVWWGCG